MATASEEFLVRFRYWLASGGMIIRMACGMTTSRVVDAAAASPGRCRFGLAMAYRLNAGAHDFGDEGCRVDAERHEQRHEFGNDDRAAA